MLINFLISFLFQDDDVWWWPDQVSRPSGGGKQVWWGPTTMRRSKSHVINGEVQRAILHAGPAIACGSLGYYPSNTPQQHQQETSTENTKSKSPTSTLQKGQERQPSSSRTMRNSTENMTDLTSGLPLHNVDLQQSCAPSRSSYGRGIPSWSDGRAAYTPLGTSSHQSATSEGGILGSVGVPHAASLDHCLNNLEPLIPSIPAELEEHLRTCRCTCNHLGYGNYQVGNISVLHSTKL